MHAELLVLRLVHVLGGIFWVGSGLFTTFFLVPSMASAGPAAGEVMAALQRRRLFVVLPAVAILTMASGLRLIWIASAGFAPGYLSTGSGSMFTASGSAAVIAFLVSLLIARPAMIRFGELAASLPSLDEGSRDTTAAQMARLRRRGGIASVAATALLIFAASGMAVARYL